MADGNADRRIVMHVNFAGEEALTFVLNNVENICDYYRERDISIELRVICHGPGLHLLRRDTSPVRERLLDIASNHDELGLYACTNTLERMTRAEGSRPELVEPAVLVPAGLPEIVELQNAGWVYLKP
jgi:intracellular sulfur oxidation DsrE/DsrF family protein